MGENIGAAARAMWNFELDQMRIVAPRDGWPNPKAVAMASGAGRLLDQAQVYDRLPPALADRTFVMATTARLRGLTKPVFTPEYAMKEAFERTEAGEKVAVLFGAERAGLENDDIARADALISVPVNRSFASINLAQCVLLMAYEWRRHIHISPPKQMHMAKAEWADGAAIEALANHYEEQLAQAGFFFPAEKASNMKLNLRNLWARMPLTKADVRIFHGILRQMVRWKNRD